MQTPDRQLDTRFEQSLESSVLEATVHAVREDKPRIDACILMWSSRRKTSRRNYHGDKGGEKYPRAQWKTAERRDGKWPRKRGGGGVGGWVGGGPMDGLLERGRTTDTLRRDLGCMPR